MFVHCHITGDLNLNHFCRTHGFSVANTMYSVIKNSVDAFRSNEVGVDAFTRCVLI